MCVNGVDDSIRFRYIHTMGKICERSHIKACVQHHDPQRGDSMTGIPLREGLHRGDYHHLINP